MLGPVAGGFIVGYFHWRMIFFINLPVDCSASTWSFATCRIIAKRIRIRSTSPGCPFGTGIGLLAYVLEVFGDHSLSMTKMAVLLAVSIVCLAAYGMRAARIKFPLLQLKLFGIRHSARP